MIKPFIDVTLSLFFLIPLGLAPDVVCYGAAVQACANGGLSKEALGVMRRMAAAGFVPDKTAYNSAIIACGEKGEWEKALDILEEMRRAGLRPDQHSYRFAMQVRCVQQSSQST